MQANMSNLTVGQNKTTQTNPLSKYNNAFKAKLNQHIHNSCIDLESRDNFFKKHIAFKNIVAQLNDDINGNEEYRKDLINLLAELYTNNKQLKSPVRLNARRIGQQEIAELSQFIACADAEIMLYLKQEETKGPGFSLTRPINLTQQKAQFVNNNETTNKLFYFSYPQGKIQTLNGTEFDDNQNKITCRQLAFAYIVEENILAKERAGAMQQIQQAKRPGLVRSAVDLTQKNGYLHETVFTALRQNKYDTQRCYLHANKLIFFPLHKFGIALAEVAKYNLKQAVYMILYSQNHAMAIIMKPAKTAGYFAVKFFDPNATNTHIRSLFKASNEIKEIHANLQQLKLTNYLPVEDLKIIFPAIKPTDKTAPFANLNIFFDPQYVDLGPELALAGPLEYQSLFDNVIDTAQEELYCICFNTNNPTATGLRKKLDQILGSNKSEQDKLTTLLFAPVHKSINSITTNYNDGHTHNARVCTSAILESNLSAETKILALKGSVSENGLCYAIAGQNNEIMRTTLQQVLDSNLTIKHKLNFLQAEDEFALFNYINSPQYLEAYLLAILKSSNTEQTKLALLNLKNKTNSTINSKLTTPILLNVYLTTLSNSNLSKQSKASIISSTGTELLMHQPVSVQLLELLYSYIKTIADANLAIELKYNILNANRQGLSILGPRAEQYIAQIDQQFAARPENDFFLEEYANSLN